MDKSRAKILILVEGARTDTNLMKHLLIEAFYHMTSIPDPGFYERVAALDELIGHTYKERVNRENRNHSYVKFAEIREECSIVIGQNIEKGWYILATTPNDILPDTALILDKQLTMLRDHELIYVLCTCVFFIAEYNPGLLSETPAAAG